MLMSSKENKALFRRANEAINKKDLTVLDKLLITANGRRSKRKNLEHHMLTFVFLHMSYVELSSLFSRILSQQ